jgi:hypothetical protein
MEEAPLASLSLTHVHYVRLLPDSAVKARPLIYSSRIQTTPSHTFLPGLRSSPRRYVSST